MTPMDGNAKLVAFLRGEGCDHAGRAMAEILSWPDERLERCHDYIQWLFPTRRPSEYNAAAPQLNDSVARLLREDAMARSNIRAGFLRMLSFYGLVCDDDDPDEVYVEKGPDFARRSRVWLQRDNHNFKRLSRMLASLPELGSKTVRRLCACAWTESTGRREGAWALPTGSGEGPDMQFPRDDC